MYINYFKYVHFQLNYVNEKIASNNIVQNQNGTN